MFELRSDGTELSFMQLAFMDAFYEATEPSINDGNHRSFKGNVDIRLTCERGFHPAQAPKTDEVILETLISFEQRNGNGEKAMRLLTGIADEFGIAIGLEASPIICEKGVKPLKDLSELIEWYEKFEFELQRGNRDIMWREPQTL